jgi:hypothetical protein
LFFAIIIVAVNGFIFLFKGTENIRRMTNDILDGTDVSSK